MKSINYALLFLGCVLFHVLGTWAVPLIDRDEPRFAEASREMIERGDYVVPHFNNKLRLDKPPLAYWTQVASYKIFGENDFAARFPSAIAAALIATSILALGKRIGGEKFDCWAAIIFTLSLQTFLHAKAAVADMWLVLFVTLAHWAGWELLKEEKLNVQRSTFNAQWGWWLLFYVSLALGFLAKGPIAWTPLLTVVVAKFLWRDADPSIALRTSLAKRFKFVRGVLLLLVVVAMWGVPALIRTHGEFLTIGVGRHVVGRSFGAMEGHGANSFGVYLLLLPFYFVTIFASLFPWSIKLPSLAKKLCRERDNADIYLLAGAAIIFVIFSLIKTKLPHYTLPAFPLIALLLARHWPEQQSEIFKWSAIVTASIWIAVALIIPPLMAKSFPAYALFRESRDSLRPEMEFGAVKYQEPSLVWYFRSRIRGWMTPLSAANVSEFMEKPGPRFVILPTTLMNASFPTLPVGWKTLTAGGFNIAKGQKVDLTLVLKPAE